MERVASRDAPQPQAISCEVGVEAVKGLKDELEALTRTITRLYNSVDEKKHATTAAKKALKSAQQRAGAKEKEKDKRIDEVMGKVQGLEFQLKKVLL